MKNIKSGVYKITNMLNGSSYIGSTNSFITRKNNHFNALLHNKHANKFLQNSYNKHGIENFKFEILATCPPEYCIKLEQWFLDTQKPKYNIRITAESNLGIKLSEITKYKIGKANRNCVRSVELRNRWSIQRKNNVNYEHINSMTNKAKLINSKKVLQFSKTNIFIKEFSSLTEAAKNINGDVSVISKVCKGILRTHKSFIFKYK